MFVVYLEFLQSSRALSEEVDGEKHGFRSGLIPGKDQIDDKVGDGFVGKALFIEQSSKHAIAHVCRVLKSPDLRDCLVYLAHYVAPSLPKVICT